MGLVEGLNRLISLFVDVLRQLARGRIWLWLVLYFLISWLLLYAHHNFTSPLFYPIITQWTSLFGQQRATGFLHYPGHYLLLPYFFEWAKLILSVLLEGLFLGAAAVLFYERFVQVDQEDRFRFRMVARAWVHLALAFVVINGCIFLINLGLPRLLHPLLAYSPRRQLAFQWVGLPFLYMVVVAAFFYVIPAIAVYGENILGAVKRSVLVFLRNPVTSFIMAAAVLVVPIIISNLANSPETIVEKFKPELVYWLLLAGLVADLVANFLWMGLSVRFLVDQEE